MSFASLLGIVLLVFVVLLLLRQVYFNRQVRHYTVEQVARKLKFKLPLVLLDVRTAGENRRGHIPGSLNIPLHELSSRSAELEPYRHREIVVYCAPQCDRHAFFAEARFQCGEFARRFYGMEGELQRLTEQ
jgi:hypothetical protein